MKNRFYLVLVVMLLFTVATVFAGGEKEKASPEGMEKVELEFALSAGWQPEPYQMAIDTYFNEEYPNVKVNITTTPFPQYHDKLATRISAGDVPDVADVNDFQIDRFVNLGALTDLTNYVKNTWNINESGWGHFYPHLVDTHSRNGVPYGIPAEMNIFVQAYKTEAFEDAGISNPYDLWQQNNWNWDTFLESAQKTTKGSGANKQWGYATFTSGWLWVHAVYIWQNGGNFWNEDRTKSLAATPEVWEAVQFVADLQNEYEVTPSLLSEENWPTKIFPTGKVSQVLTSLFDRPIIAEGADFEWGIAPLPKKEQYATWASGWALTIPRGSPNPDMAWNVIETLSSVEVAKKMMSEGAGGIPVVDAFESGVLVYEPPNHAEVFQKSVDYAVPAPWIEESQRFQQIWQKATDAVNLEKKTAKEAMQDIEDQLNALVQD